MLALRIGVVFCNSIKDWMPRAQELLNVPPKKLHLFPHNTQWIDGDASECSVFFVSVVQETLRD